LTKKQKKLVRQNGALLISADEKVLFRSGTKYGLERDSVRLCVKGVAPHCGDKV
jgi:hypothetical protein